MTRSNINCHSKKDLLIWTAPNLQVYCPPRMKINKKEILIGLSFLQLRDIKDNYDLLAYRFGLANQKVKNFEEIPEWYENYYKKSISGISSNYKPEKFEKLIFEEKKDIWKFTQRRDKKIGLGIRFYETYLWLNSEKNDIYCVIFVKRKPPSEEIQELFNKIIKLIILGN